MKKLACVLGLFILASVAWANDTVYLDAMIEQAKTHAAEIEEDRDILRSLILALINQQMGVEEFVNTIAAYTGYLEDMAERIRLYIGNVERGR